MDRVLQDMLSPEAYAKHQDLTATVRQIRQEEGRVYAQLWIDAEDFRVERQVKPPPSGWDFLFEGIDGPAPMETSKMSEPEKQQWRGFWNWYLPLEARALKLVQLIERAMVLEAWEIHTDLWATACRVRDALRQWRSDSRLPWLPSDRARSWRGGTITEVLSHVVMHCDGAPAQLVAQKGMR